MKRFIRYLYEYEQGKRIRNVGFVKVEAGNEETTLHMQGKGFHQSGDRKLVLYLFYEGNGSVAGIRQREVNLTTPVLSEQLSYDRNSLGILDSYSKINGIILETESGRRIAATWDDRPVDMSRMKEMSPEEVSSSEEEDVSKEDMLGRESDMSGRNALGSEELSPDDMIEGLEEENEGRNAPELAQDAPQYWRHSRKITKIRRQDLAKLPRCEWKLANNQFLIHGYNNYHHLLIIEEGNVLKLGVPGIYHIKEAKCADTFGFGEFLSVQEIGISLNPEERHESEPFGYWCRPVKNYYNNAK